MRYVVLECCVRRGAVQKMDRVRLSSIVFFGRTNVTKTASTIREELSLYAGFRPNSDATLPSLVIQQRPETEDLISRYNHQSLDTRKVYQSNINTIRISYKTDEKILTSFLFCARSITCKHLVSFARIFLAAAACCNPFLTTRFQAFLVLSGPPVGINHTVQVLGCKSSPHLQRQLFQDSLTCNHEQAECKQCGRIG